jgi:hypothetical protein
MRVSKSKYGEILVQEKGFVASYINNKWYNKLMFDAYEMAEDLIVVRDEEEAKKILEEALEILK